MAAASTERSAWRALSAGIACLTGSSVALAVARAPLFRHNTDDEGRPLSPPWRRLCHGWHLSAPVLRCDERAKAIVARKDIINCFLVEKFHDLFEVEDKIGEGGFGTVFRARDRVTGMYRAVKTIRKDRIPDYQSFKVELEALAQLDHPRIIKLVGFFEEDDKAHLVLELCRGPDLFEKMAEIRQSGSNMPLPEVSLILKQMIHAVVACNDSCLMHRDIKPENFMIKSKDKQGMHTSIKLIDLGYGKKFLHSEELFKDKICKGTLSYMAPECVDGQYGRKCDVWSLGAIFFLMLFGETLFDQQKGEEVILKMLKNKYCTKARLRKLKPEMHPWVTAEARDLLWRMLEHNPAERISIEEALQHPFIMGGRLAKQESETKAGQKAFDPHVLADMQRFAQLPALKQAAVTVIAHLAPETNTALQRKTFRRLLSGSTGKVSQEKMENFLTGTMGLRLPDDWSNVLSAICCPHGEGNVTYLQFLAATLPCKIYENNESLCRMAFRLIDSNNDGRITAEELKEVFSSGGISAPEVIISEVAADGASYVDYEGFRAMMLDDN